MKWLQVIDDMAAFKHGSPGSNPGHNSILLKFSFRRFHFSSISFQNSMWYKPHLTLKIQMSNSISGFEFDSII